MTLAGSTCVNSGRMDKQMANRTDSFNCRGCCLFGIARGGFASCPASPLPRWCAGRFGVCECPGKVCPARRCLTRRSAAPQACPHCQRWRQTCRDAYSYFSMQDERSCVLCVCSRGSLADAAVVASCSASVCVRMLLGHHASFNLC